MPLIKPYLYQDYTQIGYLSTADNQYAGHPYDHLSGAYNEPGSDWADLIGYWMFVDGFQNNGSKGGNLTAHNGPIGTVTDPWAGSNAADLDGVNQYFDINAILDTPSAYSNGIAVGIWFNADDGQPAGHETLIHKVNVAGADEFKIYLDTTGVIIFETEQAGAGVKNLIATTIFANGASTGWHYLEVNWDITYGKRLWLDGVLENTDGAETVLMGDDVGAGGNFTIGAGDAGVLFFNGGITLCRVRDQVLTQKDIDIAWAVKYENFSGGTQDSNVEISAFVKEDGDDDFISQISWGGLEVARKYATSLSIWRIYRYGGILSSDDKLRIEMRRR